MLEIASDFTDSTQWDAYVEGHPESRFCHLWGYRAIERAYGYKPNFFGFLRDGKLAGVLPLYEAHSLLFGRRLVSAPFSEYGGFLCDSDWSDDEFRQAVEAVDRFARSRNARIELHGRQGLPAGRFDQFLQSSNHQQYAFLSLDRPIDNLYSKVLDYQVRKAVQKAQRSGLTGIEKSDPDTLRDRFFPLYLASMKRLGAPPHPFSYFLRLKESFGDRMKVFWACQGEQLLSGLLGFCCGRRVNIISIVSSDAHWELRPNDLVHWEFVRWAHENGFSVFDFGSVRYEGQLRFKKKWGCEILDHAYYFPAPANGQPGEASQATFNSSSPLMTRMSDLWSRFVPDPVARIAGPVLRRQLVR